MLHRPRFPPGLLGQECRHAGDQRQALHLETWDAAIGDGDERIDVVRTIIYAQGKERPWDYVAATVPGTSAVRRGRHVLERQATDKERQYARYADNPSAYLATCIRARAAAPPARLDADRGGYIASWLPDGREALGGPPMPSSDLKDQEDRTSAGRKVRYLYCPDCGHYSGGRVLSAMPAVALACSPHQPAALRRFALGGQRQEYCQLQVVSPVHAGTFGCRGLAPPVRAVATVQTSAASPLLAAAARARF